MKKFILSLLLIVCCMFCFSGCNNDLSGKYWEDTSKTLVEYFNSETFKSVLSYSQNLNDLMEKEYGNAYLELKDVYNPLFEQTIYCSQKYANVFMVVPTNDNNNLKGKFKSINTNIQELKSEVLNFLTKKSNFESHINFQDEKTATSEIEKARLNKFKIEYLKLISKSYELSNNIYTAYTIGYGDFIDFNYTKSEDLTPSSIEFYTKLALNGSNLELVNSSINVLQVHINKEMDSDYAQFWQNSQKFFNDALKVAYEFNYAENFKDDASKTNIYNKFKVWKGVCNQFVEDAKTYNDIVKDIQIDILKKNNNDPKKYALALNDVTAESKANYYLNYYKNVELLYNYSVALISE